MTIEEMQAANYGATPSVTCMNVPQQKNTCCPPMENAFNEGMPKPLTEADYNAIPVNQLEQLSKVKYMDELHQADKLAADFNKGTKLNAIAKVQGAKKFAQNYKVNLPD